MIPGTARQSARSSMNANEKWLQRRSGAAEASQVAAFAGRRCRPQHRRLRRHRWQAAQLVSSGSGPWPPALMRNSARPRLRTVPSSAHTRLCRRWAFLGRPGVAGRCFRWPGQVGPGLGHTRYPLSRSSGYEIRASRPRTISQHMVDSVWGFRRSRRGLAQGSFREACQRSFGAACVFSVVDSASPRGVRTTDQETLQNPR